MVVRSLRLANFRNYAAQELQSARRVGRVSRAIMGRGRRTLLEAVCVLATTKSPLVERDRELIRWNERAARLGAEVELPPPPNRAADVRRLGIQLARRGAKGRARNERRRRAAIGGGVVVGAVASRVVLSARPLALVSGRTGRAAALFEPRTGQNLARLLFGHRPLSARFAAAQRLHQSLARQPQKPRNRGEIRLLGRTEPRLSELWARGCWRRATSSLSRSRHCSPKRTHGCRGWMARLKSNTRRGCRRGGAEVRRSFRACF